MWKNKFSINSTVPNQNFLAATWMIVLAPHPAPKKNWNDLSVLSTLSIRPSNSQGRSLKPQSLFSISTFLSKTTNWQPVSTTNPQIRTVTYCTRLPTHLTSKTQFRTPNFSDSVGSAAKIQTLTPNATKCLISFPNVAILTASCLKHSIVSKTSIENPLLNHQPPETVFLRGRVR